MRTVVSLVVALAAVPVFSHGLATAEGVSNPAFLGIAMSDDPRGVAVLSVTAGTGADRAGLQKDDVILAMDGAPLPDFKNTQQNPASKPAHDVLGERIAAHSVGDEVHFRVIRNRALRDITAVLSSRTDVMEQHVVNSKLDVSGTDLDSKADTDLRELAGHTTVIGWTIHVPNSSSCDGCVAVLERLAQRLRGRSPDAPRVVLVTSDDADNARRDRDRVGATMPVVLANAEDIEAALAVVDSRRLSVTISDPGGVAQFVSVILPGADDEDAMIDEIVAAVEQANHHARR